ncbi:Uncharacterised protein [Yersinia intermedia]|uniref:hypothetical protein n=1 Tax=Yersinia intermedia TaxID=631 RepID=UPI0005E1096B|nr:hypothetical protein [Yersinia intermedia]CNB71727.1 Uncharacterised protein [Yersinia intermedia]CNG02507.1 Uncharacterised protein [Yersinia intermedia]
MHSWEWHDFDQESTEAEADEFDQYNFDVEKNDVVTREFWAGSVATGHRYAIGFVKSENHSMLNSFLGNAQHNGKSLTIPESGAWVVSFDLADGENSYEHVELDPRALRNLVDGVARALYDHYNVSKAGLYFWISAREELVSIYDKALGLVPEKTLKLKPLPLTENLNQLGENGRGYAIITKYY